MDGSAREPGGSAAAMPYGRKPKVSKEEKRAAKAGLRAQLRKVVEHYDTQPMEKWVIMSGVKAVPGCPVLLQE